MLRSRIVPYLLMQGGGLVKTEKFKDSKYVGDPLNTVKIFNEKQVDELTVLDIEATAQGREPDYTRLRSIAVESRMPLCYGGGVHSADQASRIISLGFEKISVSAAALTRPKLIAEMAVAVGQQSVIVTLDVRKKTFGSGYTIYTHNGRYKHAQGLLEVCSMAAQLGAGEIVINSIDRDGTMMGYDLELARQVRNAVDCPLSFVGGAGNVDHMQALIDTVGVVGVGVGSMFVFKGLYRAVLISYEKPARLGGVDK